MPKCEFVAAALLLLTTTAMAGEAKGRCAVEGSTELSNLTVTKLHALLRQHATSASDIVAWHLSRISRCDDSGPELNAVVALNPEARSDAQEIDKRLKRGATLRALEGVPTVVKGNYNIRTHVNDGGSAEWAAILPEPPLREATEVTRLRAAGALILGRSNLDDLAYGGSTTSSRYGQTRHPHAIEQLLSPGGSSGGSAVAVFSQFAVFANGTDDGGSNRIPAQLTGVVGLKTTYGLVSKAGVIPTVPLLDHHGPIARTVEDVARVLGVVAGYDPADPETAISRGQSLDYVSHLNTAGLNRIRVGMVTANFPQDKKQRSFIEPAFAAAVAALKSSGIHVEPVDLPIATAAGAREFLNAHGRNRSADWLAHRRAGANALRRYFQNSYGDAGAALFKQISRTKIIRDYYQLSDDEWEDTGRGRWEEWPTTIKLKKQRQHLVAALDAAMHSLDVDLLLWPTLPFISTTVQDWPAPTALFLANLSGCPELSVPIARSEDGTGGVNASLFGRPFDEALLMQVGHALQQRMALPGAMYSSK